MKITYYMLLYVHIKVNFLGTEMQYKIQKTHTQENSLYHSSTDL